jgi:23S rRNA pseudouridine2605 synthase
LIAEGRTSVDGATITDPAIDVGEDAVVMVDGNNIELPDKQDRTYIMFHKPLGVTSTMKPDLEPGPSLQDFVDLPARVYPVGRLDRDSSGLLLLTDDGDLTQCLTHPRHQVQKAYLLKLNRELTREDIRRLSRGVVVDERKVEVDSVIALSRSKVSICIHEGRKRIVRRLMGALGLKVLELKRVRIGTLSLGHLGEGRWRKLKRHEVEALKKLQ